MLNRITKTGAGFRIAANIWYCLQIVRGGIAPALATWLIFGVTTTISWFSYVNHLKKHSDGGRSFQANPANRMDPFVVWPVALFIVFVPGSSGSLGTFDIGCLLAVGAILAVWAASKNHMAANLLIQLVMLVAYFPTFHRLAVAERNTESFVTWGLNLASALFLLVPPMRMRDRFGRPDWLSIIYGTRGAASMLILMAVMAFFELSPEWKSAFGSAFRSFILPLFGFR